MNVLVPVCRNLECNQSAVYWYDFNHNKWHDARINFIDPSGAHWTFMGKEASAFSDAITLRMGDFNLDGYPDFLVTLYNGDKVRVTLVENNPYSGKFEPRWNLFEEFGNTILGTFSDFDDYKNSVRLDVLLVQQKSDGKHQLQVYRDETENEAFYLKVGKKKFLCCFCCIVFLQVLVGLLFSM